jgi:hypothetical protein
MRKGEEPGHDLGCCYGLEGLGVKEIGKSGAASTFPLIRMYSSIALWPPLMWYWERMVFNFDKGVWGIWVMALDG